MDDPTNETNKTAVGMMSCYKQGRKHAGRNAAVTQLQRQADRQADRQTGRSKDELIGREEESD